MRTSMVQNNGINNQTNFKGIKLVSADPASAEKFGKIIGELSDVAEFKKPNIHFEPGIAGVTLTLKKLFGGDSTYIFKEDLTFETAKNAILGLIKK